MKFRTTILFLAAISAFIAVAIYAATQVVEVFAEEHRFSFNLPSSTMLFVSIPVYIVALASAVLATLIDSERLAQSYVSTQGRHEEGLREQFRSLES